MSPRVRLLRATDRMVAVLLGAILLGSTLAFGGAVWWARPALAALTLLLLLAWLARAALAGSWRVLKSPLGALGFLALVLAAFQIVPLPSSLVGRLSPRSHAAHGLGVLPDRVQADDPSTPLPEASGSRVPISVDRSATLRWLVGAALCLAVFWVSAHYADRLNHTLLVWGCVVGSLVACSAIGAVQLLGGAEGLYGFVTVGQGPAWAPSTADLVSTPNVTVLRPVGDAKGREQAGWTLPRPDRPASIGGLMGGPGAYLALASLGLPLALGLALQLMAPRGSREPFWTRMRLSGRAGLVALLVGSILASSLLIGLLAGPILALPFALGLVLAGLPAAWPSGLRWSAVATTLLTLAALGGGVALGRAVDRPAGGSPLADPRGWDATRAVWTETLRIARDFPLLGTGLGNFGAIHPYYKSGDEARTTALSSLLQWAAESGLAGVGLLALGLIWCAWRLPGALRRVGSADRALAFGLLGAVTCFLLFSAVHWTVELAAVALAASAVGGTWNRWLAGGTDLFVERV